MSATPRQSSTYLIDEIHQRWQQQQQWMHLLCLLVAASKYKPNMMGTGETISRWLYSLLLGTTLDE
jgi:hypothetical protein